MDLIETLETLIKVVKTQYATEYLGGHQNYKSTTVCPGDRLYQVLFDKDLILLPW